VQKLTIKSPTALPLVGQLAELFESLSQNPLPTEIKEIPAFAEEVISLAYYHESYFPRISRAASSYMELGPSELPDPAGVVVCFSGGKDSLAAALKLRASGRLVRLLHIAGINRYLSHELHNAEALAEELSLPLDVLRVSISGKSEWIENPIRNLLILALAADYASQRGIRDYCLGDTMDDKLDEKTTGCGLSDAQEFIEASGRLLSRYYRMNPPLHLIESDTDSHLTVQRLGSRTIRELMAACNMPLRFRALHRRSMLSRFPDLDLLPGRCGACHKCAAEWLTLLALRETEPNRGYALRASNIIFNELRKPGAYRVGVSSTREAVKYLVDPKLLPEIELLMDDLYGARR